MKILNFNFKKVLVTLAFASFEFCTITEKVTGDPSVNGLDALDKIYGSLFVGLAIAGSNMDYENSISPTVIVSATGLGDASAADHFSKSKVESCANILQLTIAATNVMGQELLLAAGSCGLKKTDLF